MIGDVTDWPQCLQPEQKEWKVVAHVLYSLVRWRSTKAFIHTNC